MVKRISQSMVDGLQAALSNLVASVAAIPPPADAFEVGDLIWSSRASKAKCLLCDAGAYSRTTYAALFAQIGTTYGAGNGTTTFNVPDGRGRGLIGVGTGVTTEVVAAASINATTDIITVPTNPDKWLTGMVVRATTSGTLPAPLAINTNYFVIRVSATTIKLATTLANALVGTAINLTTAGTGNLTLTNTLTARALGQVGGEENHILTVAEMPAHTHGGVITGGGAGGSLGVGDNGVTGSTASAGDGGAHNNMAPYLGANLFIYAGV